MNNKKILLIASVLVCIMMVFSGCGKETGGVGNGSQYTYVPVFREIDAGDGYIQGVHVVGEELYTVVTRTDSQASTNSYVMVIASLVEEATKEIPLNLEEGSYIQNTLINQAGNLLCLLANYDMNFEKVSFSLMEISKSGEIVQTTDLTQVLINYQNAYIQNMEIDQAGRIYLGLGEAGVVVLTKDGTMEAEIKVDGWINNLFADAKGQVYITYYGNEGMEFKPIDIANKSLGSAMVPDLGTYGNILIGDHPDKALLSEGKSLYIYDFEKNSGEKIFDWLDCSINGDELSDFGMLEDGKIWVLTRSWAGENAAVEWVEIERKLTKDVPQKTEITYGTMYLDQATQAAIVKFNKSNEKYKISLKYYGSDDYEDYEANLARMNSDVTSGNAPDIINLSNLNIKQLGTINALEDLYTYIDQDANISREDYQASVLKSYEIEGKLRGIAPSFTVTTLAGKESLLGKRSEWNIEEMIQFINEHPDAQVMQYATASSILYTLLMTNIDSFVDWNSGECYFTGEEFTRLLEFANQFEREYDYENAQSTTVEDIRSGKMLLMEEYLSNVEYYQLITQLFNEPVNFIGYPMLQGNGNLISTNGDLFGISSKSANKEGAWEFIKLLLELDYQKEIAEGRGYYWGFPIHKEALEISFKEAMKEEYYTDENGKEIKSPKTTWGYMDADIEIYAATQEEIDGLRTLIESASGLMQYDAMMFNIIDEETAAYFAGQKSPEEVADIIQSRIKIYINESK